MSMKRNSAAAGAIIMALILGNALVGMAPDIGYHAECTDGIDNNLDGYIDGDGQECSTYPWADGDGESGTSIMGYYGETSGYSFLSNYMLDYSTDPAVQQNVICAISLIPEAYHEGEGERADEILILLNIGCQGGGP